MAQIQRPRLYRVHHRYPSLRRHGIAVEYFPRYVHRDENLHAVDVVLLSVILRGRGRHLLDGDEHPVDGCAVDVTHYGQQQDIVTDARGMEIYNVYLDLRNHMLPVLPEELRPVLSAILPIHPRLAHQLNRRVSIRFDQVDHLVASLARMEHELRSAEAGSLEVVQHCFQIFLIDLCRAAQQHGLAMSPSQKENLPVWVERIRQDLDRDFCLSHDLATLARRAGVSVAYLCRTFKIYTGKTVVGYLVERRIQAAIWKLRESNDKVLSVALACGFNDLAYFNRAFKRITGLAPLAYRRSIQPAGSNPTTKKTAPSKIDGRIRGSH